MQAWRNPCVVTLDPTNRVVGFECTQIYLVVIFFPGHGKVMHKVQALASVKFSCVIVSIRNHCVLGFVCLLLFYDITF